MDDLFSMCEGIEKHFPYIDFRIGQLDLIKEICRSIESGGVQAIEAPNGIGKTVSILTNVSYFIERYNYKFVYLVRTHRQIERVLEELSNFSLRVAPIRGKGELCTLGLPAEEVYKRCGELRRKGLCYLWNNSFKIREDPPLTIIDLIQTSKSKGVCPYFWSIRRLRDADLVVAPLNYLLDSDPWKILSDWLSKNETVLIVDEAHNLSKHMVDQRIKVLNSEYEAIAEKLSLAGVDFIEIPREYATERMNVEDGVSRLFVDKEGKLILITKLEDPRSRFVLFRSVILLSGTWGPDRLVRKEIGRAKLIVKRISPNWGSGATVLVTEDITTKYLERDKGLELAFNMILGVSNALSGNLGVFVTSYEVMKYFREMGFHEKINKPVYYEDQYNESMLSEFRSMANRGGAVLFGVQSGRLSEGEDFPRGEMISSIVLGLQLPKPDVIQKIRRAVEIELFGEARGIELLNAVRAAAQAAGRCIRGPEDVGFIVLADYRFLEGRVREMMPYWISGKMIPVESGKVPELARKFSRSIVDVQAGA